MKDKRIQIEKERLTIAGKVNTVKKMAIKTGNEIKKKKKKRGKNIRKLQNKLKKKTRQNRMKKNHRNIND